MGGWKGSKKGERIMEKEFKVTIKSNSHILLDGKLIAVLGQWNRFEDLDEDTLYNQVQKRKKSK